LLGSGDLFAFRDPHGIRPAFYYASDEVIVVASERPVIQTVFDLPVTEVKELMPGQSIVVKRNGNMKVSTIHPAVEVTPCSFERIYFSRGTYLLCFYSESESKITGRFEDSEKCRI